MAQITQYFDDIRDLTYTASAPVVGGQLVEATAGDRQVGPAGASSARVVGVAAYDAAAGEKVNVLRHQMVPLTAPAGGVTAGDKLIAAAAGAVAVAGAAPDARFIVGQAVESAAAAAPFRGLIL